MELSIFLRPDSTAVGVDVRAIIDWLILSGSRRSKISSSLAVLIFPCSKGKGPKLVIVGKVRNTVRSPLS